MAAGHAASIITEGTSTLGGGYSNSCSRPQTVNTRERMFSCWLVGAFVCVCVCTHERMHTHTHSRSRWPPEGKAWAMMVFLRLPWKCVNVWENLRCSKTYQCRTFLLARWMGQGLATP